jgi:bifunctional DNase/RNase
MCSNNGKRFEIDSRPSDAIAIGLRFGVPIFTNEKILSEAGIVLSDADEEDMNGGDSGSSEEPVEKKQTEKKSSSGGKLSEFSADQLNTMLDEALTSENYEKAAKIRDELNKRNLN